jgi:DNA-binding response OmpR family regulator
MTENTSTVENCHYMQKRILIAEDEAAARETLAEIAKIRGYDVTTVTNGVDLLSIVTKEKFDVVITDLMMKDLNGASAAEIMKLQGNTIPVVALTGVSKLDIRLVENSFTRIFCKPVDIKELFEYIETLVSK